MELSRATAVNLTLEQLSQRIDKLEQNVDGLWFLLCFLVAFVNQLGFSLLESGTVRAKNAKHVLLKNLLVTVIVTQLWYLVGWGELWGPGANGFIGVSDYALVDSRNFSRWLIQLVFVLTAITIESGAMVERTQLAPYLLWAAFASAFVYPTLAHWIWQPQGWLRGVGDNGVLDTAGGLAVHSFGGVVGLVSAALLGPRHGYGSDHAPPGYHSYPLIIAGIWFLVLGWCPFNMGGEVFTVFGATNAGQIAVNTLLGGCASGLFYLLIHLVFPSRVRFDGIPNAILAGLSALTSACSLVEPWAAFPIGVVAALSYTGMFKLLEWLHIDDPVNCVAVHLGGGAWGIVAIGLFADRAHVARYVGRPPADIDQYGAFMGGGGVQLGVQLLGLVVTLGWSAFWSFAVLYPCRYFAFLRIAPEIELSGLDNRETAGPAYPDFKLKSQ